ncbi:hypothetical protein SG18_12700 [Pandoraea apista]|nr:hypothetical protein SG18_12700 [Pandoraea apista]AKH72912.1 hypothetical protein XM39_12900 [Pandoraea apista]AKI61297.1 hypothetical protein AA956_05155 [Pandoraea apista]
MTVSFEVESDNWRQKQWSVVMALGDDVPTRFAPVGGRGAETPLSFTRVCRVTQPVIMRARKALVSDGAEVSLEPAEPLQMVSSHPEGETFGASPEAKMRGRVEERMRQSRDCTGE